MTTASPLRIAALVVPLYVAFGCSAGLLQVAVPSVLQAQGMSIERAGMLALLYLPFGLSALWAPLVDRFHLPKLGRRKSWVLLCQSLVVLALLLAAFAGPGEVTVLVTAMAVLSISAATMDVALDGYVAETASARGQAARGGMKVGGMLLGTLLGSIVVLAVLGRIGWTPTLAGIAVLSALAALPFLIHREPGAANEARGFPSWGRFFKTPGIGRRMAVVVLIGLALGLGLGAPRLLLVQQGYPLTAIGTIFGPVAALAGLAGAVLGAALGSRTSIGAALRIAGGVFLAAMCALAGVLAFNGQGVAAIGSVVAVAILSYAAIFSGVCALAVGWVRPEQAATDYSITQSGWNLSIVIGTALSGVGLALSAPVLLPLAGIVVLAGAWVLGRGSALPNGQPQAKALAA